MLEDALAYPRRGENVLVRHLIGALLMLGGFLFFPILLLYGYLVGVVRGLAAGDPDPPEWADWEGLLVDGIKYFAVSLVYGLPAAALSGFVGVASAGLAAGVAADSPGAVLGFAGIVGLFALLSAVVGLAAGYLLPAAIVHFVLEEDVWAAFHLRTIASNALTRPYFVAWLKTIAVGLVLAVVGGILMIFFLVGLLVFFYLAVVGTYLLTDGYLAGAGHDAAPGADAA